jgi:Flp pilus assembly protein TadD
MQNNLYRISQPIIVIFLLSQNIEASFLSQEIKKVTMLIQQKRYKEATEKLKQILKSYPKQGEVYFYLGVAYDLQNKKRQAIRYYYLAIKFAPNLAEANNNLAVLLRQNGQNKKAAKYLKNAIRADPNYQEAYYNLGLVLEELGRLKEAKSAYLSASKLSPKDPDPLINLGAILQKMKEYKRAKYFFQKAISVSPQDPIPRLNLAEILFREKKKGLAAKEVLQAIRFISDELHLKIKAANLLRRMGNFSKAIELFRQILPLRPQSPALHSDLALALKGIGDIKGALKHLKKAIALDSNYAPSHLLIANLYTKLKRCKLARDHYNTFIKLSPQQAKRFKVKERITYCERKTK